MSGLGMKYPKEYFSSLFSFPIFSALLRTNLEVLGSAYLTLSSELDLDTLADVGAVELAAAISNMGVMVRSAACHTSGCPSSKSSRRSEAAVVTWLADAAAAVSAVDAEVAVGAMTADSPPLLITSSACRRTTMF